MPPQENTNEIASTETNDVVTQEGATVSDSPDSVQQSSEESSSNS